MTQKLTERQYKKISASMDKISWSSDSSLSSVSTSSNESNSARLAEKGLAKRRQNDPVIRVCGTLEKMSNHGLKRWHRRYFVLTDYILQYYSDPSKKKHHGTILLANTFSRPTIKKDGAAFNKKFSFKVERIQSNLNQSEGHLSTFKNEDCFYFSADSLDRMNEFINYFNLASNLQASNSNKSNNQKPSNRSSSNHSIRQALNKSEFMSKQQNVSQPSSSTNRRRSNSAPTSPMAIIRKTITINESANTIHSPVSSHKISTTTSHRSRSNNLLASASTNSIYDSFEKPLKKVLIAQDRSDSSSSAHQQHHHSKTMIVNLVTTTKNAEHSQNVYNQSQIQVGASSAARRATMDIDREKFMAATIAANNAAIAAIEKDKERERMFQKQQSKQKDSSEKLVNNFYNLSTSHMNVINEILKKLHLLKNQSCSTDHQLHGNIHLNNQLSELNENIALLQSQLDEFNLILTESLLRNNSNTSHHHHQTPPIDHRVESPHNNTTYLQPAELTYSHLFPSSNLGRGAFNVVKNEPIRPKASSSKATQPSTSGFKPVAVDFVASNRRDLLSSDVKKLSNNYFQPSELKSNQVVLKPIPVMSYNVDNLIAKNQIMSHGNNQNLNEFVEQNEMAYFDMKFTKELANLLYPEKDLKDFKTNE